MYKSNKIYILTTAVIMICCFFISTLVAQVSISGKINSKLKGPMYAGYYCTSGYVPVSVSKKGKYNVLLPRFEECILIFFQKGSQAELLSINTDFRPQQPIKYNIKLLKRGETSITTISKRLLTVENGLSIQAFDLDQVMDKVALAHLMGEAILGLQLFYDKNTIPTKTATTIITDNTRQSVHAMGKEIYRLSEEIKGMQSSVKQAAINLEKGIDCEIEKQYLYAKMALEKAKWQLALLKIQQQKTIIQQKELAGKIPTYSLLKRVSQQEKQQELSYNIASIEQQNKLTDCEFLAATAINDSLLKNLTLDNIRLKQRAINAQRLYKQHNDLATLITGRNRRIELASAQKYVFEQEQIKLILLENEYAKLVDSANIHSIQLKIDTQKEWVYQAKMGYLEHLWHLRQKPNTQKQADSLFEKHNQLNNIKLLPHPLSDEHKAKDITTESLINNIKIKQKNTLFGNVINIVLDNEKYEIIIDNNGHKKYYKNEKPITALTYRFETERKFGKMLQNIKYKNDRKKLRDWFEEKINSL